MKGGGDAVSAARAVIQTGEYDYAWNMQVEDEILQRLEKGGKGIAVITPGGNIEHIQLNSTDPWTEVDGERSSLEDQASAAFRSRRQAGARPCWSIASRSRTTSTAAPAAPPATSSTIPSASARRTRNGSSTSRRPARLLEDAGWKKGPDGIRAKDGKKLKFVYQTSINTPRQKNPGDRQAGGPEGRYRHGAQVGDGLGVFLLRRRQPRHLREVLLRHPDVHDDHDAARSRDVHEPVHLVGGRHQGEQVAGPQHHALEERGVRQDVPRGRGRARPGQARGPVHHA